MLSFPATVLRSDGSNWRIASRLAGHEARNLSKSGGGGGRGDDDALPLPLLLKENEWHGKAEKRMTSDERNSTVVGSRSRIAAIVMVTHLKLFV